MGSGCAAGKEIDGQLQDTRIPFHNETHGTQVLCCQSSPKNVCPLELLDNPLVTYNTTKTYCVSDLSSPILCCGDNSIVGVGDIEGWHGSMNHLCCIPVWSASTSHDLVDGLIYSCKSGDVDLIPFHH
jgi:hypothetical protein